MKFSSKGRYAIASLIFMALSAHNEEQITIISIAQTLGISKIYLEQVFSMLKRANIVTSIKGAQGGYRLVSSPDKITVGEIARAVETGLFEKADSTVALEAEHIDKAMESMIWDPLDLSISETLDRITLKSLADESDKTKNGENYMFFI